jgi:UrcA family protein
MMMRVYLKSLAALGLFAMATAPVQAQPGTNDETVVQGDTSNRQSIMVRYADLNLAHKAGVTRLENRVRSAARTLCLSGSRQPLSIESKEHECFSQSLGNAMEQVDRVVASYRIGAPLVAAILVSQHGNRG